VKFRHNAAPVRLAASTRAPLVASVGARIVLAPPEETTVAFPFSSRTSTAGRVDVQQGEPVGVAVATAALLRPEEFDRLSAARSHPLGRADSGTTYARAWPRHVGMGARASGPPSWS
jgi:hypothetical protein